MFSPLAAEEDACEQAVIVTDPVLATQILRNKAVDKLRFMYSFLDVVRAASAMLCDINSVPSSA